MRSAGVFVLAFVASTVAGVLAYAAVSFLPDWDDAAGRGLGDAYRALLVVTYLFLGMILYGFAAWRSDREQHFKRARTVLLLVPFAIATLGLIDNGTRGIKWLREIVGMVQMFAPLWAVAVVQWLIVHRYLPQRTGLTEMPSTSAAGQH